MDISKMENLDIVLLCGLYGSGKMEFAQKYFQGMGRSRISRSEIRRNVYEMTNFGEQWTPDRFSEENDALVKHIERKIVEHLAHQKKKILLINTFITRRSRQAILDLARQTKKTIGAVFLNRTLEQCLDRNSKSALAVPQEVIYKLNSRIELPEKSEGFNEVMVVTFK
ncbi:MAG: AAA family ATPase [Spirochaetes bacterium]|nr:AAA family ATPase [Spirochaetota bacterium]